MNDKIIISICGAAGTGKSALANEMTFALSKDLACRVPTDYFLKSSTGESYEQFISTPFKYDWHLLQELINKPISSELETPDYDFSKFTRLGRTGGRQFTLKRYVFIDSMLPYPFSNYIIKLIAPENLRLERIKKRDSTQHLNSARSWQKMELTAKLLDESGYKFDIILKGEEKTRDNAGKIVEFFESESLLG
ncbi:MAG TPA: hypothetical protein VGK25_06025 [Ignavibacteria bacterium]|jgi:uridine kinase